MCSARFTDYTEAKYTKKEGTGIPGLHLLSCFLVTHNPTGRILSVGMSGDEAPAGVEVERGGALRFELVRRPDMSRRRIPWP